MSAVRKLSFKISSEVADSFRQIVRLASIKEGVPGQRRDRMDDHEEQRYLTIQRTENQAH